jgi:TldD protein
MTSPFAPTRREFLAVSALSVANLGWDRSQIDRLIPEQSRAPMSAFIPDPVPPEQLRTLAQIAIDTARQNGASYADVRISSSRRLLVAAGVLPSPMMELTYDCSYGVRAMVDGVWAFSYGVEFTRDGVAAAARSAVTTARGLKAYVLPRPQMTPRSAVQGAWSAPVGIDPFGVSPDEHARMIGAYKSAASRVLDGEQSKIQFIWTSEERVFASTEGSLITQQLGGVEPTIEVQGTRPAGGEEARLRVGGFSSGGAGFECMIGPEIQERIKSVTEDARLLASYASVEAEVGRYPAVFDGMTTGTVLTTTLVPALEMDRVLGYEADSVGTSFLSPAADVLGRQLFSPKLSLIADRSPRRYGAAKWDDEGVETETFPIIQSGKVVDYFATRSAAAASESSVRPRGSGVAYSPSKMPLARGTYVTMPSDSSGSTLSAMVKTMSNGLLVMNTQNVTSNQQLAGGLFQPGMLFEVKGGQIIRRLRFGMVQFRSKTLWNNMTAVGNESTAQDAVNSIYEGEVWRTVAFRAPAVQLKEIDIIQPGRRYL